MNERVSLVIVACLTACSEGPVGADPLDPTTDRIVGGSAFADLPAVGALTYYGTTFCTGTLVSARTVVTAGHCTVGVDPSRLRFVIGARVSQPEYVLTVASLEAHPYYNDETLANDIGLVHLANNAPVAPMRILPQLSQGYVGKSLLFVGYGATHFYGYTGAGIKRAVWMPIDDIRGTSFSYRVVGKNTCSGDSGGPAFARDTQGNYWLAGVTSYGDATCREYGVNTRADTYAGFIGSSAPPALTQQGSCGDETYVGRCDGPIVIWCENDRLHRQSCATDGNVCGWSANNQYYACVESTPSAADPCHGETYMGRCDENEVVWCEGEEIKTVNCGKGHTCGFDAAYNYFNCL